jgi:hypothetical protein
MKTPRLLKADEISVRVQSISDNGGAVFLLYKDARVDMAILDETYGPTNWMRTHEAIDGKMFCTISVWDDVKKCWVCKQDVGVESNMDATKGEASDAFKRAGTNWGIGRELYTAPFIFVYLNEDETYTDKGKKKAKSSFGLTVKDIGYNEKNEINKLVLVDRKGAARFTMGKKTQKEETQEVPQQEKTKYVSKSTLIDNLCQRHNIKKETFDHFLKLLQDEGKIAKGTTEAMTGEEFKQMLSVIHQTLEQTKAS